MACISFTRLVWYIHVLFSGRERVWSLKILNTGILTDLGWN